MYLNLHLNNMKIYINMGIKMYVKSELKTHDLGERKIEIFS